MFDFCMSWICIYNLCAQAFPVSEDIKVGAEARKYQVDSAIMATVILDLQPFNQVNRYLVTWLVKMFKHFIYRAGFQMLTSALDPSFTLSSDWYYRGLLAKVPVAVT